MYRTVIPSEVSGEVVAPPSKSHTLRALLFASLADGVSTIHNPLLSSDSEAMLTACQQLGATFHVTQDLITITGNPKKRFQHPATIYVNNSGITLRFLTALASLSKYPITFSGDSSVHRRPMTPLLKTLSSAGAQVLPTNNSQELFSIFGLDTFSSIDFFVEGSDSQFVSSLLITLPLREQTATLHVSQPGEFPWVRLTLAWLKQLGIRIIANSSLTLFTIFGKQSYPTISYTVPGDFSSAAFLLAAGLLKGNPNTPLCIRNLDHNDSQGDKAIFHLMKDLGADITFYDNAVTVSQKNTWNAFSVDANHFIDAIPILSVLALFAKSPSRIYNAKIAKTKECDRLVCTTKELRKLGAKITIRNDDELIIYPSKLVGAHVYAHQDHRLAMALSIAALKAKGSTIIHETECVNKSYPNFFLDLSKIHVNVLEFDKMSRQC